MPAMTLAVAIIAHRGASHDAPENTLAAFKLGYAQQADGCELDLRVTKDHRLIVSHDASTKRAAGVDKKISDQTFDELRRLEVGQWGKWQGKGFSEKLPTLDEALALIPEGRKFYLHGYCAEPDIEAVARSVKRPEQVVFICFEIEPCKRFKQLLPQCQVFWLRSYKEKGPAIDEFIQPAKDAGLDGLSLDSRFPITKALGDKIQKAGLELHVWTIDDVAVAKRWIAAGVKSITTNRPQWLREQLRDTIIHE
jgi:glycerophosphoryl diester phosphodiesterase